MGLIALLIKCTSRGPVFYRHERVGYRRQRFVCLKFRTMTEAADHSPHAEHFKQLVESDHAMIKIDVNGDKRIFPLGRFLRATGLDELPQLFNVLRGEMSLVGPRPCLPYEEVNYGPRDVARFEAMPGLTGLWQVSGKNSTSFSEMIAFDLRYARTKSLPRDLWIIAKTMPVLAAQTWAWCRQTSPDRRRSAGPPATAAFACVPSPTLNSQALADCPKADR
jgi:lipopolysaccharide/colanic/teichoic acid biosynthesis glycosyltransferase